MWKLGGDPQEEHSWNLIPRRSDDDDGASCYTASARVVHVERSSGRRIWTSDAVRAINNLAPAQIRKDTPSLIDVKGLGRSKEFTGREEDFQQWSV